MKKRFGQHFLTNRSILRRIVEFAKIHPEATVVEIGPGAGALTTQLAAVARRVIAIEIDRELISPLRATMPTNVEILEGDALEVEWPTRMFQLAGNLPYNVATALLKRCIEHREHTVALVIEQHDQPALVEDRPHALAELLEHAHLNVEVALPDERAVHVVGE